jgi:undecaprenyl-diphosphatase
MSYFKSGALFESIDQFELVLCRRLNRICHWEIIRKFFSIISRLGNGVFWYILMSAMLVLDYPNGITPFQHMALAAILGVIIYKILKQNMVRQRPYLKWDDIKHGTAPLDLYSFPSGHTLHAVLFTYIAIAYYPLLAWTLIPFTILIGLSRVILGLHYPTDVIIGAIIGFTIAYSSFLFF